MLGNVAEQNFNFKDKVKHKQTQLMEKKLGFVMRQIKSSILKMHLKHKQTQLLNVTSSRETQVRTFLRINNGRDNRKVETALNEMKLGQVVLQNKTSVLKTELNINRPS